MQAKPKIGRLLVIVLIVSLVLSACGGGTTGSTWFNLPSVKLVMRENGTANLYGINLNSVILQPSMITQLQSANVQRVEARSGYNGIHVYLNGEDMPYIDWDAVQMENLQAVVAALPPSMVGGQNPQQIAKYLPWLRKIGLGVRLDIPLASGATALQIPKWKGETAITTETAETTVGPIVIASLVFDENGQAYIEGVPVSELENMLGTSIPLSLDANTVALLQEIGADSIRISTQPNGIDIMMNEEPLPGLAYDTQYLQRTLAFVDAFVTDEALVAQLNQLIPMLPGIDLTAVVSFTGEPVAQTDLGEIKIVAADDGTLSMSGVEIPSATLPADLMDKLQSANVQQLGVNFTDDSLAITSNGRVLPTLSLADDSINNLAKLVGPIAGIDPAVITEGLGVVKNLGADVTITLPAAEGAEPVDIPANVDTTMKPAELGDINRPVLQLSAKYGNGGFTELAGLSADMLDFLGVTLPTLPPDLINTIQTANISEIGVSTDDNKMNLMVDGSPALTVNYDLDSLKAALEIATPFLGNDSPLSDPALRKFIDEQILPIVPASQVDVSLEIQ